MTDAGRIYGLGVEVLMEKVTVVSAETSDGLGVGDSDSKIYNGLAELSDVLQLIDQALGNDAIYRVYLEDQININDSNLNIVLFDCVTNTSISISDMINGQVQYNSSVSDGVVFQELNTFLSFVNAYLSDKLIFSASNEVQANLLGVLLDKVIALDINSTSKRYWLDSADGVKLNDYGIYKDLSAALVADSITVSESTLKALIKYVSSSDGIELSDTGERVLNFHVSCTDAVTLTDAVTRMLTIAALLSDGIITRDMLTKTLIRILAHGDVSVEIASKGIIIKMSADYPSVEFDSGGPHIKIQ